MKEKQFAKAMASIPWPKFGGIGANTSTKRSSHPRNSGIFFLGAMLTGKRVNKKIVFTNEPF